MEKRAKSGILAAWTLALPVVLAGACMTMAQDTIANPPGSQLLRKSYWSDVAKSDREYWLYLPVGYGEGAAKRWPVILFLHGGGERGNDVQVVLKHGPLTEVAAKGRDLPFIIIAPQMPPMPEAAQRRPARKSPPQQQKSRQPMVRAAAGQNPGWGPLGPPHGWHEIDKELLSILDATLKEFRADPDRVYLTGLSYGGFGSWYMASHHPGRWAAVAPICGAGEPSEVHRIGKIPVWLFQGGRDTVVRPEWSLATADALEAAGGDVRVTVHEDLPHNCWTRVYEGRDLYDWFLSHRRAKD